ncbi:MAG: BlaI/MecI/CopY family transcriptional regulator [Betaproteobacteria bacterium]
MVAISDAEAQVMEVLWERSPQSTDDIALVLVKRQDWQLATIKTLLNRLLNKGAISAVQEGRRYSYTAVLQRTEWLAGQSTDLIDRVFGGRVAPLVAHFSQQRKLKPADIAALKALIKALERD